MTKSKKLNIIKNGKIVKVSPDAEAYERMPADQMESSRTRARLFKLTMDLYSSRSEDLREASARYYLEEWNHGKQQKEFYAKALGSGSYAGNQGQMTYPLSNIYKDAELIRAYGEFERDRDECWGENKKRFENSEAIREAEEKLKRLQQEQAELYQ